MFLIVASIFPILDRWFWLHPTAPYSSLAENSGALVGFIVGGFLGHYWFLILILVNGLVLRRYKSRIAAGLFILFGLFSVGLSLFALWEDGFNSTFLLALGFFGLYVLVAAWTLITLIRLHSA